MLSSDTGRSGWRTLLRNKWGTLVRNTGVLSSEYLQQIQQIIDKHYPQREEHILLVIRAMDGRSENTFKIWKSV